MKMLRSTPDNAGTIGTSIYKTDSNNEIMLNINCASNVRAGSPGIACVTYRKIAICKRVDGSNFCVQLLSGMQFGSVVEIYAEGGSITIFPPDDGNSRPYDGIFLDGTSSFSTSGGAQFRYVITSDDQAAWARIG